MVLKRGSGWIIFNYISARNQCILVITFMKHKSTPSKPRNRCKQVSITFWKWPFLLTIWYVKLFFYWYWGEILFLFLIILAITYTRSWIYIEFFCKSKVPKLMRHVQPLCPANKNLNSAINSLDFRKKQCLGNRPNSKNIFLNLCMLCIECIFSTIFPLTGITFSLSAQWYIGYPI